MCDSNGYTIPVREGFAKTDETVAANGNIVTLRTITIHGEFDSAVVFSGGWRVGTYKRQATAQRRVAKELAAPAPRPHRAQDHHWAFLTEPVVGEEVRIVSWGTRSKYRTEAHGTYLGLGVSQWDGDDVHWFRGGAVGSTEQGRDGKPGHWTLPAFQLTDVAEAPAAA